MPTSVSFYIASTEPTASSDFAGALLFNDTTKTISRCKDDGSAWEAYGGASDIVIRTTTGDESSPSQGKLYVNLYDRNIKIYTGSTTGWITLAEEVTTTVRASSSATDTVVPTEKAVRTAIDAKFGTTAGLAPVLDANGKLSSTVIPAYALSEYISGTFANLTALVAAFAADPQTATGDLGDYAVTTDNHTYILSGKKGTVAGADADDWTEVKAVDTNTWRPFKVGNTTVSDTSTTLEYAGGSNVSLSYSSGTLTIAATDTTYSEGTGIEIDSSNSNAISVKIASSSNMLTTNGSGELIVSNATATASTGGTGGSNGLLSATDKEKIDKGLTWQTVSNS